MGIILSRWRDVDQRNPSVVRSQRRPAHADASVLAGLSGSSRTWQFEYPQCPERPIGHLD